MIPPALLAPTTATIKKSWLCTSTETAAAAAAAAVDDGSNVPYGRKVPTLDEVGGKPGNCTRKWWREKELHTNGRLVRHQLLRLPFFAAGWNGRGDIKHESALSLDFFSQPHNTHTHTRTHTVCTRKKNDDKRLLPCLHGLIFQQGGLRPRKRDAQRRHENVGLALIYCGCAAVVVFF